MTEFDIIRRFFLDALMPDYVQVGPGDDCAVFSVPPNQQLCVSTDTLLAGVHFPLDAKAAIVASRACGANLSDLAAMGAEPYAMTVALTLPSADEGWLGEFSKAMLSLAAQHHCPIVGGNLTKGDLSITITVMGVSDKPILRSTAQLDDDIYVSGRLGDAAGAVEQLGTNNPNESLLDKYNSPQPRLALGSELKPFANAIIDVSDGFLADLNHLLESSGLGAKLELSLLPLSDALTQTFGKHDAMQLALYGGDDYELCFTANAQYREEIEELSKRLNIKLSRLGTTVSGSGIINELDEQMLAKGYEHF